MAAILLLEDDITMAESLIDLLKDEGYAIEWVRDGNSAIDATCTETFDLMLLDVNVPGLDGFTMLQALRDGAIDTPAIFITALQDTLSLAKGFEAGANDFIRKPFDFDELLIRMQALIRQSHHSHSAIMTLNKFSFHIDRGELYKDGEYVALTGYEQHLVQLFFRHLGSTLTKGEILYELGHGEEASEGALRVRISKLRKIGLSIQTVKSVGYRLDKR